MDSIEIVDFFTKINVPFQVAIGSLRAAWIKSSAEALDNSSKQLWCWSAVKATLMLAGSLST